MTERNFEKELSHSVYYDMEDGNDTETNRLSFPYSHYW
jgi:hypothetical protein